MRSELFYWILNMSISSSIAGLAVYLIGRLRKIPRRILCVLWMVPFLRMWIPVGWNSRYSLISLLSRFTAKTVAVKEGSDFSMTNFVMGADAYFPVTYKTDALKSVFEVAAVVWGMMAAALLAAMLSLYLATKADLKKARPLQGNIYIADGIPSPAVTGIFRQRILLPREYDAQDLRFILMHENAHIKRKDNLRRIVAIATACVHWFNPLSWLFLKSFLESLELACDEAVLRRCGEKEKKAYAGTLLRCAESRSLCASAFGGAKVRVRIEHILAYKKLSAVSAAAFITLAVVVGYVLLTNAK